MGNYSGSRTASFQIIRVSGGGGGGIVSASAFLGMGDEYVGAAVDGAFGAASSGSLVVDGSDLGLVLFGEDGEPLTFTARARVIADAQGGEHRYICFDVAEPETADGDYGEPRLRLNMDVIAALRAEGYTDVEMNVGSAQARIPMDTLYAEYVDERGAFAVGSYEIRLWPLDAGAEELAQSQALADVETFLEPYHFELVALPAAKRRRAGGYRRAHGAAAGRRGGRGRAQPADGRGAAVRAGAGAGTIRTCPTCSSAPTPPSRSWPPSRARRSSSRATWSRA